MRTKRHRESGFTVLELLVVIIALLGVSALVIGGIFLASGGNKVVSASDFDAEQIDRLCRIDDQVAENHGVVVFHLERDVYVLWPGQEFLYEFDTRLQHRKDRYAMVTKRTLDSQQLVELTDWVGMARRRGEPSLAERIRPILARATTMEGPVSLNGSVVPWGEKDASLRWDARLLVKKVIE
ncbi:MAG: type II secretion system protein [Nanoarchaeota archaeon]